jgi:GMP reductase
MKIEDKVSLDIEDVWIKPKKSYINSRADVDLTRDFKSRWHRDRILYGVPVIVSNMWVTGTPEMARALAKHKCWVALDKSYSADEVHNAKVFANSFFSIGESEEDLKKLDYYYNTITTEEYAERTNPLVNFEVAYCFRQKFIDKVKRIRERYPNIILMVGDVGSGEAAKDLVEAGADIVRLGLNFGSQCRTKYVTGVYVPSFSLALEVADAAHGVDGLVCSDGGCRESGDVAKFLGAGVDFVMSSSIFAGCDECRGEIILKEDGKKYMKHFGSASQTALDMRGIDNSYRPTEGITSFVECKGPVDDTMKQLLGGLRSSMSYVGAKKMKEFHKRCYFIRTK